MPIVHIHKITSTIGKAISYGKSDKVERNIEKDDIADSIAYAKNDKTGEVIFKTLTTYHNSDGIDFAKDCRELLDKYPRKREIRDGEKPALLFHLVQGFDGYLPPQLANQIGRELSDEFLNRYIVQISTHTNTENIHNHIIFCAVNLDGVRYNDCDSTMAELRKCSDRICEKYGLEILDGTREYKPIHWTDDKGIHHSFEPTQRKKDMIEKRKNGEISRDDISSYRNFEQYEKSNIEKITQREIVKRDIDTFLPMATDYEHLLAMLRENLGYRIKDKKKDGSYLEHILFISPSYSKGVRDCTIGDGNYYTRKNLEKIISDNLSDRSDDGFGDIGDDSKELSDYKDIPIIQSYSYKDIDLGTLDEERRAWKKKDDSIVILKRGEPEKTIIRSAKNIEKDSYEKMKSDGFERWQSEYILHHAFDDGIKLRFNMSDGNIDYAKKRANEIQERLDCLHFLEENNLYDYNKINEVMDSFWRTYNSSFEKLNEVGSRLEKIRFLVDLPNMLERVNNRMKERMNDADYVATELEHDKILAKKYFDYLSTRGLIDNKTKIEQLKNDLLVWETKYHELSDELSEKKNKLIVYERSVEILRNSCRGSREEFADTWRDYDKITSAGKNEEHNNEETRRKQKNYKKEDR